MIILLSQAVKESLWSVKELPMQQSCMICHPNSRSKASLKVILYYPSKQVRDSNVTVTQATVSEESTREVDKDEDKGKGRYSEEG